jgi:LysM domain
MVAIYAPKDDEQLLDAMPVPAGPSPVGAVAPSRWNAPGPAPDRPAAPADRRDRGGGLEHGARPAVRRLPDRATRMRRRRLIVLVAAVLVAVGAVAGVRALSSLASVPSSPDPAPLDGGSTPVAGQVYVVQPGDTLWSLAQRIAPDRDPRPVVDALRRANGGPDLQAGDRLRLEVG